MTLGEIQRDHIEPTLAEFQERGRSDFVHHYGFGFATSYLLRHSGRFYDPKAVVGVAHQFTGESAAPLKASEFDATEAIARLRKLGFTIVDFSGLWWVNQGSTYRQERDGGYVWAPKLTKAGFPVAHHTAVADLRIGQRIVHYANGHIRAIGVVVEDPQSFAKPDELKGDAWDVDGNICRVAYRELEEAIPLSEVPNRAAGVGPFNVNGAVNQGYLYRIAEAELLPLLEFLYDRCPWIFDPVDISLPRLPVKRLEEALDLEPDELHELLRQNKNVILEGVPGTGKTFAIERLAREWEARTGRPLMLFDGDVPYRSLVMHPSTTYEDFVEGLRPGIESTGPQSERFFDEPVASTGSFGIADGFFLSVCAKAVAAPDHDVLVLLDELNRCNVPSVLGDLLLVLEGSRRASFKAVDPEAARASDWVTTVPARLPYSGRTFFVPDNVYVIATANTTDRSVAPLDAALRRRFAFYRLEPSMPATQDLTRELTGTRLELITDASTILTNLNLRALGPCLGPDAMLGHSYVYALAQELANAAADADPRVIAARHWRFIILPQVIDSTRAFGAEDLLSAATRAEWFAHHSEIDTGVVQAEQALADFDRFIRRLGITVIVEGTGLSRGARIGQPGEAPAEVPVDQAEPGGTA